MRTLVLGGIRSGKSGWAETAIAEAAKTAGATGSSVRYLATGPSTDSDAGWAQRVAAHQHRRPADWTTVETHDVAAELRASTATATLVDDIGGWLTAAMDRRDAWDTGSPAQLAGDVSELLGAVGSFGSPLVLVSPEVGWSVVPGTAAGRRFADEIGLLNQQLAAICDRVVLVVAGLAIAIKPEGGRL